MRTLPDNATPKPVLQKRLRVVMIILPALIGTGILVFRELLFAYFPIDYRAVYAISLVCFAVSALNLLLFYLRGDISLPVLESIPGVSFDATGDEEATDESSASLREEIELLKSQIAEIGATSISLAEGQQAAIVEAVRGTISQDLASELEQRYSSAALTTAQLRQAKSNYKTSVARLTKEIGTLTRRSNLNLAIGVLTTLAAVGLLVYMVLGTETQFDSFASLVSYFVPRVTVVVFIEVFAFFFLKLYRSNLTDIKFYQQEITRILAHQTVYESVVLAADKSALLSFVNTALDTQHSETRSEATQVTAQIEQLSKLIQETSKVIANLSGKTKAD